MKWEDELTRLRELREQTKSGITPAQTAQQTPQRVKSSYEALMRMEHPQPEKSLSQSPPHKSLGKGTVYDKINHF